MNEVVYIGNVNFCATEGELLQLAEEFGPVFQVRIIKDRETGRPRGFAFVTFEREDAALKFILEVDGALFMDRVLKVSQANPRTSIGR